MNFKKYGFARLFYAMIGAIACLEASELSIPVDRNKRLQKELKQVAQTPGVHLNILSANLHLFPAIINKLGSPYSKFDDKTIDVSPETRSREIASAILEWERTQGIARAQEEAKALGVQRGFDVLLFQEAWDKNCRDIISRAITDLYPYSAIDDYESMLSKVTLSKLNVIMGSGLAIYSKHPLIGMHDWNGNKTPFILERFQDYRGDECFANKGMIIVMFEKEGVPFIMATTHLQAGGSDIDKYFAAGASRATTDDIAEYEMEQIKSTLAFVVMQKFFPDHLEKIEKEWETNQLKSGFLENLSNQVRFTYNSRFYGDHTPLTNEQKRIAFMREKINEFSSTNPEFWNQCPIFLGGDFNIGNEEQWYEKSILGIYGKDSATIFPFDEHNATGYSNLEKGVRKVNHRIDHILSLGEKYKIGGSYVSDIMNHLMTDHVASVGTFVFDGQNPLRSKPSLDTEGDWEFELLEKDTND